LASSRRTSKAEPDPGRLSAAPEETPVRVLLVIKQLGMGGAERLLVSVLNTHDRSRFAAEVAYIVQWDDALGQSIADGGTPVHSLGVDGDLDVRWIGRLRALLVRGDYDIVHTHSPIAASVVRVLVRTLPAAKRPRVVSTEHDAWQSYRRLTRIANALTMPLDDATLTVSEILRETMPAPLRSDTRVVVHGVPTAQLDALRRKRNAVRATLGVKPDEVFVVTVANMVVKKRYEDLLDAAGLVVREAPRARFYAVGRETVLSPAYYRRHADLGLGDHFVFLGARPDATELMAGADLFVLASDFEGNSIAIMEALALGVPVINTAAGGTIVRHNVEGKVVPRRDPRRLAAAILELVEDDPLRTAMSNRALSRARALDISVATRKIESVYDDVLSNRPTAAKRLRRAIPFQS
jgi:L-malate glycosyltransferase